MRGEGGGQNSKDMHVWPTDGKLCVILLNFEPLSLDIYIYIYSRVTSREWKTASHGETTSETTDTPVL